MVHQKASHNLPEKRHILLDKRHILLEKRHILLALKCDAFQFVEFKLYTEGGKIRGVWT